MKLGTKGRYAVMAMVDLAGFEAEQLINLSDLSQRQDLPLSYLEQLFARLTRVGLVKSIRGPKGGYTLAKPPHSISVADIVFAAEEEVRATRCAKDSLVGCTGADHFFGEQMDQLEDSVVKYLERSLLAAERPSLKVVSNG